MKFQAGTLVRIKEGHPREDLVSKSFVVGESKVSRVIEGNNVPLQGLFNVYQSPFPSLMSREHLWVREVYLEEVDPDDGFEFEEDYSVWVPKVEIMYGNAYA